MAHACSAFAVALLVWAWLRVRRTWSIGGAMLLGAAAALAGMVREQDALLACGPALDAVLWAAGFNVTSAPRVGIRGLLTRALAAAAAFVIVYLPQAVAYISLNGHLGPSTPRDAQDDLVRTARVAGVVLTRARIFRLDAAGAGRHCRIGPDGPANVIRSSRRAETSDGWESACC